MEKTDKIILYFCRVSLINNWVSALMKPLSLTNYSMKYADNQREERDKEQEEKEEEETEEEEEEEGTFHGFPFDPSNCLRWNARKNSGISRKCKNAPKQSDNKTICMFHFLVAKFTHPGRTLLSKCDAK